MILHRCFTWNERARPTEPDGALWFPRIYQGDGRHDNPDRYGCLYLADREVSAVVEQLSRFRGQRLIDEMLVRRGLRLGLASIELPDRAQVIDLDGTQREFTVPELLVLKNEVIPRLEEIARATPTSAVGVNIFDRGQGFIRHREIARVERKKETVTDKGLKIEDRVIEGYDVREVTDYGLPAREVWNEVDRIQEFAERVKQAVQEANKTELVEL